MLAAIDAADVVVVPPSNPVVTMGTILRSPGSATRCAHVGPGGRGPPVIGGAPVRGMADACLTAIGVETSAAAVARHYGAAGRTACWDAWLVDERDADAADALRAEGWAAGSANTLMTDVPTTARIAADALALVGALP